MLPSDRRAQQEYDRISPAERARQDFLCGHISAGEFERRLELAFVREDEQDTTVIDRITPFEMPSMTWDGAQEESMTVVLWKMVGGAAAGIAIFAALFVIAAMALGVAGLVVHLLGST